MTGPAIVRSPLAVLIWMLEPSLTGPMTVSAPALSRMKPLVVAKVPRVATLLPPLLNVAEPALPLSVPPMTDPPGSVIAPVPTRMICEPETFAASASGPTTVSATLEPLTAPETVSPSTSSSEKGPLVV